MAESRRVGGQTGISGIKIKRNKEVSELLNLNKKNRKVLSTIVIVVLVLAMVLPMVVSALVSVF